MLTLPFIFISEDAIFSDEKLSVQKIFEKYEYKDEEFVKNMVLNLGILGEEEDEGKNIQVCISIKGESTTVVTFPYKFGRKNCVVATLLKLDNFPIIGEGTIFFEVYESEKLLGKFPLSFKKDKTSYVTTSSSSSEIREGTF